MRTKLEQKIKIHLELSQEEAIWLRDTMEEEDDPGDDVLENNDSRKDTKMRKELFKTLDDILYHYLRDL